MVEFSYGSCLYIMVMENEDVEGSKSADFDGTNMGIGVKSLLRSKLSNGHIIFCRYGIFFCLRNESCVKSNGFTWKQMLPLPSCFFSCIYGSVTLM